MRARRRLAVRVRLPLRQLRFADGYDAN
jgi:hypothetical protein